MTALAATALATASSQIESRSDAERLLAEIGGLLDRLLGVIREETRLIRHAKLTQASGLEADKAALSRDYVRSLERLRSNAPLINRLAPVPVAQLRQRHEAFKSELQVNMAVLATARSVAEGLVRGVAEEVQARTMPRIYGSAGVMAGAMGSMARAAARPLTVSRSL